MTTKVDIFASPGVPVDVTPISRPEGVRGETVRIAANAFGTAYVHSKQDLLIREIQPADLESETAPVDPEPALKKGK